METLYAALDLEILRKRPLVHLIKIIFKLLKRLEIISKLSFYMCL